jgi:hypothetical protein
MLQRCHFAGADTYFATFDPCSIFLRLNSSLSLQWHWTTPRYHNDLTTPRGVEILNPRAIIAVSRPHLFSSQDEIKQNLILIII